MWRTYRVETDVQSSPWKKMDADMTWISKEGLRACLTRLQQQARVCHWGPHVLSERVDLRGVDNSTFQLLIRRVIDEGAPNSDVGWRVQLTVPLDEDEDEWPEACSVARRVSNLMGLPHEHGDNEITICPHPFDEKLETRNKSVDFVDLLWKNLMAVLQTQDCCCGRARKHSTDSECCLCLLEGSDDEEAEASQCPLCWKGMPPMHYRTDCCDQAAHVHCMQRCDNRCFNCRARPLIWKR